ncbi:MAG: 16S rRNA (uracil(1498)-N(3))-methyltransferase [Clostridia bacterium]|nr:16S rRNA (uracil(1498)-N(3))-methyltransferase [Clostridia bacterium]
MAGLKRFFADGELSVGAEAVLSGDEFEHAKNVLRIAVGDEVMLLDGSGKEFSAIVSSVEKRRMVLNVVRADDGGREALTDVFLAFGYLKNADKNEFIVQKAVELGVKRIVAFSSQYSSAFMNENKLERLNKVAREAAKQCLRSVAPKVEYCSDLKSALLSVSEAKNKIFACEFQTESQTALGAITGSTALVVGSEGGFSKEEQKLSEALGFSSVTLGKRILRAETAAVALVSVAMFALGELGDGAGSEEKI